MTCEILPLQDTRENSVSTKSRREFDKFSDLDGHTFWSGGDNNTVFWGKNTIGGGNTFSGEFREIDFFGRKQKCLVVTARSDIKCFVAIEISCSCVGLEFLNVGYIDLPSGTYKAIGTSVVEGQASLNLANIREFKKGDQFSIAVWQYSIGHSIRIHDQNHQNWKNILKFLEIPI